MTHFDILVYLPNTSKSLTWKIIQYHSIHSLNPEFRLLALIGKTLNSHVRHKLYRNHGFSLNSQISLQIQAVCTLPVFNMRIEQEPQSLTY